jgi:5-methyltetrahydrofolate--homocysteine methyltransferase
VKHLNLVCILKEEEMDPQLKPIYDGIIEGDRDAVTKYVQEAVDAGLPAEVILKQGLVPAMSEVGRMF